MIWSWPRAELRMRDVRSRDMVFVFGLLVCEWRGVLGVCDYYCRAQTLATVAV
jgi:hypothetical protein